MSTSERVHDEYFADLSSLAAGKKKSQNLHLYELKEKVSDLLLAGAYKLGLGYGTLASSIDEYNSALFRDIVVEAQALQQADETQLVHCIAKGNLLEVQAQLDSIESTIRETVTTDFAYASCHRVYSEVQRLEHQSAIYQPDVTGANIVHVAYQCKHYHIGRYLVKRYPRLGALSFTNKVDSLVDYVNKCDSVGTSAAELHQKLQQLRSRLGAENDSDLEHFMLYTGQNILHMTIMRRDYAEVRWLLDFYWERRHAYPDCLARLLNANAVGKFFHHGGSLYLGSNPLQFAVCTNDAAMFDLVYSFVAALSEATAMEAIEIGHTLTSSANSLVVGPEVIFATDELGNNALHLCVYHGLQAMYEHVARRASEVLQRRIRNLYVQHCNDHELGITTDPRGKILTLSGANEASLEMCEGYRLHEKVLFLPEHAAHVDQWVTVEAQRKLDERLELALNNDLHSPLTLAAFLINKKVDSPEVTTHRVQMLRFLVEKAKQKAWDYGPKSMSVLDLDGIEIKHNVLENYICTGREHKVRAKQVHSAIGWLCIHDADAGVSIPDMRALIQAKWERVGYPRFVISFLLNCALTICVTLILLMINATPRLNTTYHTEIIVDVLYPIAMLSYLVMLLHEVRDVLRFGLRWSQFRGVALYDRILRFVKIATFVTFIFFKARSINRKAVVEEHSTGGAQVLYHVQDDHGMKVSLVVCVIASFFHLYYYFMGFDVTGPFVLTMFRIISSDVPYFLNFYMVIVVATACSLSALSAGLNPSAHYGIERAEKGIWTLIQKTVGIDQTTQDYITVIGDYPEHLRWIADIILTAYFVTVLIMLLNLLIAMISNTYAAYSRYSGAILLITKYNIMEAAESAMFPAELKAHRAKYCRVRAHTKVHTVEDALRAKPQFSASLVSVKHAVLSMASQKIIPQKAGPRKVNVRGRGNRKQVIEEGAHRVQEKYLFELQSVNTAWYTDKTGNGRTAEGAEQRGDEAERPVVTPTAPAQHQQQAHVHISDSVQKTTLLLLTPQADFHAGGAMAIEGAAADSERIVDMLDTYGHDIHHIVVVLCSRHTCHITHAVSWHRPGNCHEHPPPYTRITYADVQRGTWIFGDGSASMQAWAREYTASLERKGRKVLTIWPEHCILGSTGHCVVGNVDAALQRWAQHSHRTITYIMKGQNPRAEMYSALQAEVHDQRDPSTTFNYELMTSLQNSDRLLVCGPSTAHSVNLTTRDLMDHWDKKMANIVVLSDGTSPLDGFETETQDFYRHCNDHGVTVCTIKTAFAGHRPNVHAANAVGRLAAAMWKKGPTRRVPVRRLPSHHNSSHMLVESFDSTARSTAIQDPAGIDEREY